MVSETMPEKAGKISGFRLLSCRSMKSGRQDREDDRER